jgi:ABC-type ATPase with predicted acetyltransferase domain
LKEVRLAKSGAIIRVPRSACVTEGDQVEILPNRSVLVRCRNGEAKIYPSFSSRKKLPLGTQNIPVQIKEIATEEEFEAYSKLAALHYRNSSKHGRASVLIAKYGDPRAPTIVGYIELASSFYVGTPRAKFFSSPFSDGDVEWTKWDSQATKDFLGVFVRISRCVVAPEFRGLGLGTMLLRTATTFAKTRWHSSGYRPLFMEIAADMLRFVPFAQKAGFSYMGDTEGNLNRVAKDMEYLTRNAKRVRSKEIVREESCGIVDQQVSRMNSALRLMRSHRLSRGELIARLGRLSTKSVLRDFALFSDIVSLPKPTFVIGLSPSAKRYIGKQAKNASSVVRREPRPVPQMTGTFSLQGVKASFRNAIRRNARTHAVQQAFGISPANLTTEVLRGVTLSIEPGEIVVVTGPSGVGKTVLLRLIAGLNRGNLRVAGKVRRPRNLRASSIRPVSSNKSLIEIFGDPDAEAGIRALSQVGLSDAFLYLRRFSELSAGQQYRAMLADLVRRKCNLAIIDEFCTSLDPITAHTVAASLSKLARRSGLTVVVAAPYATLFLDALQPDKVVTLSSYGNANVRMLRK